MLVLRAHSTCSRRRTSRVHAYVHCDCITVDRSEAAGHDDIVGTVRVVQHDFSRRPEMRLVTRNTLPADAGCCSEGNVQQIADAMGDVMMATGRISRNKRVLLSPTGPVTKDETHRARLAQRLRPTQSDRSTGIRAVESQSTRRISPASKYLRSGKRMNAAHRLTQPLQIRQCCQTRHLPQLPDAQT